MAKKFHLTLLQESKDYTLITLGLLMYAVGYTCFQLPYEITTGGVAGIGALLYYTLHVPTWVTFLMINIPLMVAAVIILGWKFSIKTIYAVGMLSFFLGIAEPLMRNYGIANPAVYEMVNGVRTLVAGYEQSGNGLPMLLGEQSFMACVMGAALEGVALGMVFASNGSTGGTDIIAAIVNKYKDVTLGQMVMFIDILIISSSLFTEIGSLNKLLYGYCTLIIANLLLDYVVDRGRQSVQFLIFSRKYDEIAEAIMAETERGITVLNGQGWYTKTERKVLVLLARRRESTNIFRIIQAIDPTAFVSQSKVVGVFGEGFDRIKAKARKGIKSESVTAPAEALPTAGE